MKDSQFTIYASWPSYAESPAQIGAQMLQSLDILSSICPLFHPWWVGDSSLSIDQIAELVERGAESEMSSPLDDWRGKMAALVEHGADTDDWESPTPWTGYSVSAYNSLVSSPKLVSLNVHAGAEQASATGNVRFETSSGEVPDPTIVSYSVFKSALTALISIWNVAEAQAYPYALQKRWRVVPGRRRYDLAWMTYLSAPLAQQIKVPSGVLSERLPDGGLLMIAAEDTFDVTKPVQMAASRGIVDALAPLNDAWDERNKLQFQNHPRGWLVSQLLSRVLLNPSISKSDFADIPADSKAQMKFVLEKLLSGNPDEATLRSEWREIDLGIVREDVNLKDKFETFLSWLR